MTTIAYRDGIMAADSRGFAGDKMPIGSKQKIHRLPDGSLFAGTSRHTGQIERLRSHITANGIDGLVEPAIPVTALLVKPSGAIHYFCGRDTGHDMFVGPLTAPFIAIGSGEEFAHGAMAAGATAVEAVRIACECDVWSAGPVAVVALRASDPAIDTEGRLTATSPDVLPSPRPTRSPA